MEREKKIRVWIGVGHIALALLLFALPFFVFGAELVRSYETFQEPTDGGPDYGGMVYGIFYLLLCLVYFIFGFRCLRIAASWIFKRGAKTIDRAVVVKFGVCFPLALHALLAQWWVGRVVYIGLILPFATAAILELVFIERLRIVSSSNG